MATIGTLSVSLKAETKKFQNGMRAAKGSLRSFASAIPGFAAQAAKIGAALGAAAVTGLALWAKHSAAAIDATAKLADRIGTTTEALQGLRYAADLSGAGAATLDKGLQFLAKSLGEARTGVGGAKSALESIGLELDAITGRDPAEQFRIVADAFGGLASQEDKAYVATKLFGRAGIALVNTLQMGRKGLDANQRAAEKLGLAYSRVDAAQVEAANDAVTRMGRVLEGVGNTLAIKIAPYIDAAATMFADWATEGEGAAGAVRHGFEVVLRVGAKLADVMSILKATTSAAFLVPTTIVGYFTKAVGTAISAVEGLISKVTLGGLDTHFGDAVQGWADDLIELSGNLASNVAEGFSEGFGGQASATVNSFLEEIQAKSRKVAQAVADEAAERRGQAPVARALADDAEREAQATERAADQRKSLAEASLADVTRRERMLAMNERDRDVADLIFKVEELRGQGLDFLADRYDAIRVAMQEQAFSAERAAEREKERAGYAEKTSAAYDIMLGLGKHLTKVEDEHKRRQDQEAAARKDINAGLSREIELLSAADDWERRRLDVEHERVDLLERGADAKLVEEITAKRLAELAEAQASAEEKKATSAKQAVAAQREQLDVTKKFHEVAGSGFGFGKSRGFASFYQPRARTKGAASKAPAVGAGGGAKIEGAVEALSKIPDPTASLKAATDAVAKLAPSVRGMMEGAKSLADEVGRFASGVVDAAVSATTKLRNEVRSLRSELRAAKERFNRAADLGIAGG